MSADNNDREAAARERRRMRAALVPATLTEQHLAKVAADYLTDPCDAVTDVNLDEPSAEGVPKFLRDSWRKMNG